MPESPEPAPRQASPYAGPVRESLTRAGGRTIRLVRPGDPDRLLEDPEVAAWNRADDYMPYWAYLWPGAFLLADAVAAGRWPAGTPTLELGCGLGLAGLVAVAEGLRVEFTDHDRTPLDFVLRSAAANGFDPALYSASLLDWRHPTDRRYRLILGADITYERRLIPLVASVVGAQLAPDGVALVTDPGRSAAEGFAAAIGEAGLTLATTRVAADGDELGPVKGTIYRISWPSPAAV